jgi:archaellum biogenesis ATPase FlaH
MQKLINRGSQPGRRNKDLLRLASWMWRGGQPEEWAVKNLTEWAGNSESDDEQVQKWTETIRRTYSSGYLYGCNDEVMKEFCDPKCIYYQNKGYAMEVETPRSLAERYREFLKKIKSGAGFDLFQTMAPHQKALRGGVRYQVLPGEVMMVTGDTGMTKTMFVQNLVTRINKPLLWLNLEMSSHLNFRRFLQIKYGMSKHDINSLFTSGSEEYINELMDGIGWLRQESIAPNLQKIESLIVQTDPEIVVIDTTDAVVIDGLQNGTNPHLRAVMSAMRTFAERYECAIICIHHITKGASRATSSGIVVGDDVIKRDLDLNDLTGDRSNVTKVDHVVAIIGDKTTNRRTLKSLKTRDDEPFKIDFEVEWKFLRYTEANI